MELRKKRAPLAELDPNEMKRPKRVETSEKCCSSDRPKSVSKSKLTLRLNIREPLPNPSDGSRMPRREAGEPTRSSSQVTASFPSTPSAPDSQDQQLLDGTPRGRRPELSGDRSIGHDITVDAEKQESHEKTSQRSSEVDEHEDFRSSVGRSERRRSARIAHQKSKLSQARGSSSMSVQKNKFLSARGLFTSIMTEAKVRGIDPLQCLSIRDLRVRDICNWAVQDIKRSFTGIGDTESLINGFVSTGKYSIVTAIPENYLFLVAKMYKDSGKTAAEAENLSRSRTWYHVVDGGHVHRSLVEKIKEDYSIFGGFRWPVVEIDWQPVEVLRSLARMCQEMQKEVHVIEFTFPEVMLNLRNVIDETFLKEGIVQNRNGNLPHGTIKKVLQAYTGGSDAGSSTLRSMCSVALKLSTTCVREISRLLTEECCDYIHVLGPKRPFGSDSRVFKKLLSTQSLRAAKSFLDKSDTTDEDRVNVIYRLRYLSKIRQVYKGFSSAEIEMQTRCAVSARNAYNRFKNALGKEEWPQNLTHLKMNLLRTTMLDKEVSSMDGTEEELLPVLEKAYINETGAHGRQLLRQYHRSKLRNVPKSSNSTSTKNKTTASDPPSEKACSGLNAPATAEPDEETREEPSLDKTTGPEGEEGVQNETMRTQNEALTSDDANLKSSGDSAPEDAAGSPQKVSSLGSDPANPTVQTQPLKPASDNQNEPQERTAKDVLTDAGIEVFNSSYEEYERRSCDIGNTFDMIICEPFQKRPGMDTWFMDEKSANDLLQFFRRVLVPGGFCFIIMDWMMLREWASFLATNQFEVFKSPFRIIKDPSKFQRQRSNDCQDMVQDALVAKKPGRHPMKFVWNRSMPFVNLPRCQFPRYCAAIDNVPPPSQKLTYKPTRTQVRPGEWSHELFLEILQSFCVEGGKVLDPFAGTLTTGIACALSGRSCVLLETEERCLENAINRLRDFVQARSQSGSRCPNNGIEDEDQGEKQ